MKAKDSISAGRTERQTTGFRLFRWFILVSLAAIAVILLMTAAGHRIILRDVVIRESEDDAIRISNGIRDLEMGQFIQRASAASEKLTIPEEGMEQLERDMRRFLSQFNIVKAKVFDIDKRIIYSTDPDIIGRLDSDNIELAMSLSGSATSKYESEDRLWDLEEEKRAGVDIVETYVPIRDAGGKVIGSFEIYKDVTHDLAIVDKTLIRTEVALSIILVCVFAVLSFMMHYASRAIAAGTVALKESEERFRGIVESAQAGYFRIDRQGHFQHVNDAWLRMHGYSSPDEVIGQHYTIAQDDAYLDHSQETVGHLLAGKSIPTGEFARRCKDGSIGFHTFSANPVVRGGEIVGVEGFLTDITDRKQAEQQRQILLWGRGRPPNERPPVIEASCILPVLSWW